MIDVNGSEHGNRDARPRGTRALPLTARLIGLHGGRLLVKNANPGGLIAELQFPAMRYLGAPAMGEEQRQPRAASR